MARPRHIYDRPLIDGRFEVEVLALRWLLIALYAFFFATGVIDVTPAWFAASEGFLVAFHVYYTWRTWFELTRRPLPEVTAYATPFMDTVAITLGLIAVGDPFHPIWAVYFFTMVGVAYFYHAVARLYAAWLMLNVLMVGVALELRGFDVPVGTMVVGAVILLAGMYNLAIYTGGERRLRSRVSEAAITDPLTGLRNRRGLEEILHARLEAVAQDGKSFALLMIDIDRFKRYNDQYGHLVADAILEQLAQLLIAAVRDPDLVARYGGDEFVAVVLDVAPADAVPVAERLREQVERSGLCTVSIGASVVEDGGGSAKELLDLADAALLEAKQAGRNCVRAHAAEAHRAA